MAFALKIVFPGDVRHVDFTERPSFAEVQSEIRSCQQAPDAVAKYTDEEGDLCLLTEDTFSDFMAIAAEKAAGGTVMMMVEVPENSTAPPLSSSKSDSDLSEAWERVELEDLPQPEVATAQELSPGQETASEEGAESKPTERANSALGWFASLLTGRSEGQEKSADDAVMQTDAEAAESGPGAPQEAPEPEPKLAADAHEAGKPCEASEEKSSGGPGEAPAVKTDAEEIHVSCGVCSEQVQMYLPSPWASWTCDRCNRSGFTSSDPLWACSCPSKCDWGICMDCHANQHSYAPEDVPTSPTSPLGSLPAFIAGALLTAPLFCNATKVIARRHGRTARVQRQD
eukprot:gb/GFBE01007705.1/.p1 GENE.gb/GFBE01007705.1/~~gb/GFBE01007705.1/.p1  ORF type:complete len:342 (+),score=61.97 gb/GFBE01007705.1/:1-1026(+)